MRLLLLLFFFISTPTWLLCMPLPSQGYSHQTRNSSNSNNNIIAKTDHIHHTRRELWDSFSENHIGRRTVPSSSVYTGYTNMDRSSNTIEMRETVVIINRECPRGFARMERIDTGTVECVDCARVNGVVGMIPYTNHSQRCVRCGGATNYYNAAMLDASYKANSLQCECPQGYELVEQLGSQILSSQMCLPCPSQYCTTCNFPYTVGKTGGCVCLNGFTTLYDNSCVPTEVYENITRIALGATTALQLLNVDNKGIPGLLITSLLVQRYANGSAVHCFRGNGVACNFLANMCVLMMYNVESLPCKLYLSLLNTKGPLKNMPQLYLDYSTTNTTTTTTTTTIVYSNESTEPLSFVVDVYDWKGNLKESHRIVNEFNLCRISETDFINFFKLGSNRRLQCSLDWYFKRLYNTAPTDFFELYLIDPRNKSNLIIVPVVLKYNNYDISPLHMGDREFFSTISGKFRRRFYVYDNIGTIEDKVYENIAEERYLTALRHVSFIFTTNGSQIRNNLITPIVLLQYASKKLNSTSLLKEQSKVNIEGGISVIFLTSIDSVNQGIMITMIILCILCFISAWIRTYSWMRRRQNMILSLGAVIRFLVYFCNHIGNMFAITVSLTTWYLFAVHRAHYDGLVFLVHDKYVYIDAMLFTATVTKGIAVIYRIIEQCNADYFVIDWERSKGQLLRENRILPVSMWRSTFVANELNELQTLRRWRPLLCMTIILLFLIGLDYLKYTMSIPGSSPLTDDVGVYSITTLRIAVSTFLWFVVCAALYIMEYQIYYRFICLHPLQAFVDLCSVSNISIMILPESQWGYYIHGESIHAHADVSMEEFQENLFLESQGNLPVRGLGGQSQCQTFEVFMGIGTRQYLYMCYSEIETERQRSLGKKEMVSVRPGKQWHFFESIFGFSRKSRVYHSETLAIKKRINISLQQSVRSAESTLLMKFPLQRLFDLAPNILYMNGPQSGDRMCKDLFFVDEVDAYGNAFLYGIDMDLFVLYTMLYVSIDAAIHNVFAAFVITFLVEVVIRWYRGSEGEANISSKTLIDDRFFL
ncbi:Meckelin [Trypanosoma melophagium]|uniref:Meckelin n=1 Tax=Trypanosoma melophagium TaxID=715481 RepID=UPI00351A91C1|nr:Meckelin [Trypanosoma melophagium]